MGAWVKVDIYTTTGGLELLGCALSDIGISSFVVKDAADFEDFLEGRHGAWDYVHSDLMKLREAETTITLYLADGADGRESLGAIRDMLAGFKASDAAGVLGRLECAVSMVEDQDWANAWKRHHEPIAIGRKLLVCPPWQSPCPDGRVVLHIDPGMAFGTGIDETTRLCLKALENAVEPGLRVLDIGCGSGILAIGALLLGAGSALGVDVAQAAVETAKVNAVRNGVADRSDFICGNLADRVDGVFDIVCANISAGVILSLAADAPRLLKPGGHVILSGIVANREQEVIDTFRVQGFSLKCRSEESGWVCITCALHPRGAVDGTIGT